jgi:LysR family transcriptional regulator for bpeEF and oprC
MDKFGGIAEFVATVEAGSFAQAAQRLGMTPSGVGKAVSRLESRLGTQLLRRSTRRQLVTESGAECYQKFRHFLQDLEAMETVSEPEQPMQGTLRLHLPPALAREFVMPALPNFYNKHPGVTLQITVRNDSIDLIEEDVDLTVRFGSVNGANIISRPVGAMQYIVACSPAYALTSGMPMEPEELLRHNCLRFYSRQIGRPRKWIFTQNGRRRELTVAGNLILNNTDALIEAAIGGIGIVQVPLYAAQSALQDGRLISLLEPFRAAQMEVNAIYSVSQRASLKINAFVEFLRDALTPCPSAPRPHEDQTAPAGPQPRQSMSSFMLASE